MAKVEIKSIAGSVLYTADIEDSVPSGSQLRAALEKAVSDRANLRYADLRNASLVGASLRYASLDRASLVGASLDRASLDRASLVGASLDRASLVGASLDGASLRYASLVGASLDGASLWGASLVGASLWGAKLADGLTLVGKRPIFMLGPIGSRSDTMIGHVTNKGLRISTGCFRLGTPEEFTSALDAEHGTNHFAREYLCALELLKLHAELYPAEKGE